VCQMHALSFIGWGDNQQETGPAWGLGVVCVCQGEQGVSAMWYYKCVEENGQGRQHVRRIGLMSIRACTCSAATWARCFTRPWAGSKHPWQSDPGFYMLPCCLKCLWLWPMYTRCRTRCDKHSGNNIRTLHSTPALNKSLQHDTFTRVVPASRPHPTAA
jgi:hypothetical protein